MMKCHESNTTLKIKNKTKPEQSKRQKCFSSFGFK